ncbi:MAG: hypothetical protein ACLFVJ_05450, partial [Persicimonas sp.]
FTPVNLTLQPKVTKIISAGLSFVSAAFSPGKGSVDLVAVTARRTTFDTFTDFQANVRFVVQLSWPIDVVAAVPTQPEPIDPRR